MSVILKHSTLYSILLRDASLQFQEKVDLIVQYVEKEYRKRIDKTEFHKIENLVKSFDVKWKAVRRCKAKFDSKFSDWLEEYIEFSLCGSIPGAHRKQYEDLCIKSKKQRLSASLSTMSTDEVSDTFKEMLKKEKQPTDAIKIANILPTASPKRLRRVAESIPTPSSNTAFTEEEALALMLQLRLSRDNYISLRKSLIEKGCDVLPSYTDLQRAKKNIIPAPVDITDRKARIGIPSLLTNTASRITSTFSTEQLEEINNCDLKLICKWGCDGSSSLSEYKQKSEILSEYKSVFMASLVPLRVQKIANSDSPSTSSEDIWKNSTPGSKSLCRPICFEYAKESTVKTQELIKSIEEEINSLEPISIRIANYSFNVSFEMKLTMIDGKVSNAITGTSSTWNCNVCGDKKSEFSNVLKKRTVKEEVLQFGISPLHARIRFLEFFLHLAYDLEYKSKPENANKAVYNNDEMKQMRASEKKRIQEEFKQQTGLNIDKPLVGYGSSNDGNTARHFFKYFETTSKITKIDMDLLHKVNIILMAINSKYHVNAKKFGEYCKEISELLTLLYPWKEMTPTVHKILCHGEIIIENNILPLGELTEESQESRNRDFKNFHQFNSRKCSRQSQNEDIFNNLMLSSDPILTTIRKRWNCGKALMLENYNEYKDLLHLLD